MTREEAKAIINALVERFAEHRKEYHLPDYNEQKARQDFINPFFKALGWDIDNEKGASEAYREVIYEDKVFVRGKAKAPDYGFRLAGSGKKRLFFVEAKKPSVALKTNKESAYQLKRYGSSAQAYVSILTNFEDFIVYDCSRVPKLNDSASVSRLKHIHFEDYIKEFDFIYDTFSHEAVTKGRFDKFVASDTDKKGSQTLDKEFVQSLDNWRRYLATSIALNNRKLNDEEINFAVQQTIDRLIFLRFCEDRAVEPYGQLQKATSKGESYKNLFDLFKQADDKYNSGLFDFEKDQITPKLKVDNKVIKSVIEELYYPLCRYEFSVMPVEVLGNAYEQFLGKVIRITPARSVRIEEKPEVRKAGGVYYTPQYIVEYIVKNTVGKLVDGKTPTQIEKIKIVDPACGSGSFLLGAFDYLLQYHVNWYHEKGYATKKGKDNPFTPQGTLTTHEKKRILLCNIFGVDLDSNAVEVTKLSLLLKCMEGETEASIKQQISLFHERVLPDLDNNIKDSNSLIDMDGEFGFETESKIKPFNWKKRFSQVFSQGGFDVVIGNPPYVAIDGIKQVERDYYTLKYPEIKKRLDLFGLFTAKGRNLLNENGKLGFIIPMQFLRNSSFEMLRKSILQNNQLEEINYVGDKVCDQAKNDTIVFILGKKRNKKTLTKLIDSKTTQTQILQQKESSIDQDGFLNNQEFIIDLISYDNKAIFQKIEKNKLKIEDRFNVIQGIVSGLNEAYIYTNKLLPKIEKKLLKKFLFGSDFDRYALRFLNHSIVYLNKHIDIQDFPLAENILKPYKKQLEKRREVIKNVIPWYSLQWPREEKTFESPKIIFQKIRNQKLAQRLVGTYDETGLYVGDGVIYLNSKTNNKDELKFLLALLNSSFYNFYYREQFLDINLKIKYLEQTSIVDYTKFNGEELKKYKEIIKIVDLLLKFNEDLQVEKLPAKIEQLKQRIDYNEERINELVCDLYSLTKTDIEAINTKSK
ncbi:MAG: N-6 DNA methylase [Sphingobacteriaceae bacterium]|nr:N-6 DNA methylase [Sphingobacteriaceae bacterium]